MHQIEWVLQHRLTYGINWSCTEKDLELSATDISDFDSADDFHLLRSNHLQLISKQHGYWAQRVKLRNEVLDGLPTRFLFNRVRQRSVRQRLISIRTPAGIWLHEPEQVEHEILSYFKNLLCAPTISSADSSFASLESFLLSLDLPSLSSAESSILSTPFTEFDVFRALIGLKLVIPSIVLDYQQAFIPGHLMSDGCLVAHEVLPYINKTKKGTTFYAVLKLDMSKAFDRVSWHFLMAVLRHMGFPTHWRDLIWECISIVSYSVLINGTPSSTFRPTSGLRQGDPLSPYLFIICMEVLSRQLAMAERMKLFTGIKISRYAPTLSHLFFADDALLCCKATPNSFEVLRDLLKKFEVVSGQMINLDKSYIKFSPNSPADFQTHMKSILKMPTVSYFGDYLGVPVDIPRKRSEPFLPLIDKFTTRIASWSALYLSQSSKLVSISSILLASLNHILSCVPIPHRVCRKIDALIAAFWWRSDWNKNSIHWLRRDILHAPKSYGGLGIKNTFVLGQALLLKKFWHITSQPTSLLVKFWTAKYQKDLPIPKSKSLVSNVSYAWSGICRALNLTKEVVCWKIGSGKLINIWFSRWVNGELPTLNPQCQVPLPPLSSFILPSGNWNPTMLFRYFSTTTAKVIIAMEPPVPEIDDFIYWKFTEDGSYSAKSGNVTSVIIRLNRWITYLDLV
ncbi:uncharacterized protein LOC141618970 [Silene latifolia]|uniref:uncharacterized protein LOC141618970 n=1 Tax=Silene latifolia TaxID=37657 RepID=UPI003D77B05C